MVMLWTLPDPPFETGPQFVPDGNWLGHGSVPAVAEGTHVVLNVPSAAEIAARC
jgi:hypothetical protein